MEKTMTPTEAAELYLDYQPIADIISGPLDRAKAVLKDHLASKTTYKGISLSTGGSTRFSQAMAKELLGPKKTDQCMVFTPSASLVLPARLRKGAVELHWTLEPVSTDEAAAATA